MIQALLILGLIVTLGGFTAFAKGEEAVFTAEQAALGKRVAERYCSQCHDQSYFEGSLYRAVQGQQAKYLLDPIQATMPQDRPGTLKPRHTAALLAWIMSLNGVASGDKSLPKNYDQLSNLILPKP